MTVSKMTVYYLLENK